MPENEGIIITLKGDDSSLEKAAGSAIKNLNSITPASVKAGKSLEDLKKKVSGAGQVVMNTGRIVQDLPFAFNNFGSIANNIDPLVESFGRLKEQAKATGVTVGQALLTSLKGAGGVGLAISAITTGITIWQMYGDKIKNALGFTKEATRAHKEFNDEIASGAGKIAGDDVGNLAKLKVALADATIPLRERKTALEEYNKVADKQNQLSLQDLDNIGKINSVIGRQIELFKERALVRAAEDKLKDLYKTMFENEFNISNAAFKSNQRLKERGRAAEEANKAMNQGLDAMLSNGGDVKAFTKDIFKMVDAQKEIGNQAFVSDKAMSSAKKKIDELLNFISVKIKEGDIFGNVLDPGVKLKVKKPKKGEFEFFNTFFGFNPDGSLSPKQQSELMDAANSFSKEFGRIFEGLNFYQAGSKKKPLEIAKAFWADLQKGMVTFKPDAFLNIDFAKDIPQAIEPFKRDLQAAYTDAMKQLTAGPAENLGSQFGLDKATILNKYADVFRSVKQELPKTVKLNKFDVPVDLALLLNTAEAERQLAAAAARIEGLMKGLNDHVAATLRDMQVQAISSIGEALGTAIAGGDIRGVFSGLFAALGTAMQDLGKALIATAIGLKAIKDAFKTLNPVVAAAAGVGLIALGAVIKGKVSGAAPFAAGGMVYGPVNALVGEGAGTSRNNPEIIAPLDKLQNIIGGGGQIIILNHKLKGNDIILSANRQNKKNRRGG